MEFAVMHRLLTPALNKAINTYTLDKKLQRHLEEKALRSQVEEFFHWFLDAHPNMTRYDSGRGFTSRSLHPENLLADALLVYAALSGWQSVGGSYLSQNKDISFLLSHRKADGNLKKLDNRLYLRRHGIRISRDLAFTYPQFMERIAAYSEVSPQDFFVSPTRQNFAQK